MLKKDLENYLKISDYEKPRDYQYKKNDFDELNRINRLLENCVKYDFTQFNVIFLLDYYVFFFEEIGKFELLFIGFKELKKLAFDDKLYKKEDFKKFLNALSINFDNLNNNLIREDLGNIHYYDVSFISDIEQFKNSINGDFSNCDSEIDFF